MNEIIVEFARLWGQREAFHDNEEEIRVAEELKAYDSQECTALLTAWAGEYLANPDVTDTYDFFNEKVEALVGAATEG